MVILVRNTAPAPKKPAPKKNRRLAAGSTDSGPTESAPADARWRQYSRRAPRCVVYPSKQAIARFAPPADSLPKRCRRLAANAIHTDPMSAPQLATGLGVIRIDIAPMNRINL